MDEERIEVKSRISDARLIVGGAAIFAAENKNQIAVINGKNASIPLVKNKLRVCVVSYIELASANRAEDERPWATIIIIEPSQPQIELVIKPAVNKPICPTEEYAINDFISGCRIQIVLVIKAPHIAIVEIRGVIKVFIIINKEDIRIKP